MRHVKERVNHGVDATSTNLMHQCHASPCVDPASDVVREDCQEQRHGRKHGTAEEPVTTLKGDCRSSMISAYSRLEGNLQSPVTGDATNRETGVTGYLVNNV